MYATNFFEKAFLNTLRNVDFNAPSKAYIGLYLENPGEEGGGQEVNYQGYKRQEIIFSEPSEMFGGIGISNTTDITFPMSEEDAGTVTHVAILDSISGGNMFFYGELDEDGLNILAGESPIILEGEASYYLNGNLSNAYKRKLLNIVRGQNIRGFTPYLSLFNGPPENGGAELSGPSYERCKLTFGTPQGLDSGRTEIRQSEDTRFNRPLEHWGIWAYTVIYDNKSNGQPVFYREENIHKPIKKNHMPQVLQGNLYCTLN